jgi:hypothetical protein
VDPTLRSPGPDDWPRILDLANLAVPFDPSGNEHWLENRKSFEGRRAHHVAVDDSRAIRGYGAVEEDGIEGSFRVFLVAPPQDLREVGDALFARLVADLEGFEASLVWAREYAEDQAIRSDLSRRGFVEGSRFTPPGHREMVVMNRDLSRD